MAAAASNNRKYFVSAALVVAGAYGIGRVYPPLGETAGTITPSERYVSSQVGENDVTLGDTAVPELMQTDAFELMTKDPSFRALAASPGFQAPGIPPHVMAALMANPKAFAALSANPRAFAWAAQAAQSLASTAA